MVKNRYKKSFGDFLYFSETCIFIQNKELLPTGISFPIKFGAENRLYPFKGYHFNLFN